MRNVKGFSLIEMLLTVSITAILFVVVSDLIINGMSNQERISEQQDAVVESRRALQKFVREIRETRDADTGAYPLEILNEQEIVFYSDVDHDAFTERIHYRLNGTTLERGVIEPSGEPLRYDANNETFTVISHFVRNASDPLFFYYSNAYPEGGEENPLAQPVDQTEVRMVEIRLVVDADPTSGVAPHEFSIFTQLRNLQE